MAHTISGQTTTTLSRYPLKDAERCIAYYKSRALGVGIEEPNLIKAYLLRTIDIFQALKIEGTGTMENEQVRVYLGMEDTGLDTDHIYKMFLVAVDNEGRDIISHGEIEPGGESVAYVYDFNTPCPNTCDRNSPLYRAGIRQ